MQTGLAEIQKNIALLTNLSEPLQIIDKRFIKILILSDKFNVKSR